MSDKEALRFAIAAHDAQVEDKWYLAKEMARVRALNAELLKALTWYADESIYAEGEYADVLCDNGEKARAAIAKAKGEA